MTTSPGSSITLRVDRYPFDVADVGVATVVEGGQTGSASTGNTSTGNGTRRAERRASDWSDGHGTAAVDRRRSFAATSFSRLSSSQPTIEDIDVETTDSEEDRDNDDAAEKQLNMRLLSEDIQAALLEDHLHLEEPLPLLTATTDCSSPEELDRVTTLHSFSPAEDHRRRRRFTAVSHGPSLYRCFSTADDTWYSSRLGGRRRTSWSTFDDKPPPVVHPAVERCRHGEILGVAKSTEDGKRSAVTDANQDAEHQLPETAYASLATVYLRDQLRAMFHVADNRLAMKMFGSHNALLKEKQRQKAVGNFVIHPCSTFR